MILYPLYVNMHVRIVKYWLQILSNLEYNFINQKCTEPECDDLVKLHKINRKPILVLHYLRICYTRARHCIDVPKKETLYKRYKIVGFEIHLSLVKY